MTVRESLRDYLEKQNWDLMFTATFSKPARYPNVAIDRVDRYLNEPVLRPTKMFVAAEPHYLGNWHCHGLIELPRRQDGELFYDIDVMNNWQKNTLNRLGFNVCGEVGDQSACSNYLSKYLTKEDNRADWKIFGRKKFWKI